MNTLSKTLTKEHYKIHLICWSVFIIYEVFITGLIIGSFANFSDYIYSYILNITLFYVHAFFLMKILEKRSWIFKSLAIIALLLLESGFYIILIDFIYKFYSFFNIEHQIQFGGYGKRYILSLSWRILYFIGFSTGYVFLLKSFIESKRADELEKQSLKDQLEKQHLESDLIQSQNNFLRSQINPHFLFNTLNFIYNDTRKKAPIAADAIMSLSEMMRYALKRTDANELSSLSEEIEHIESLINLHKLRTQEGFNFELNINCSLFGLKFPPLILLTLVENIFKHGNYTHSTQPAQVIVDLEDNILTVKTINIINILKAKESTKVGMENIHKRLESFYKKNYSFTYGTDLSNKFITEIKVNQNLATTLIPEPLNVEAL